MERGSLLLLVLLSLLPPAGVAAQTPNQPAARNVVKLSHYNGGGLYRRVHDLTGIRVGFQSGDSSYVLATLAKVPTPTASSNAVFGLAVINTTNPSQPREQMFFRMDEAPSSIAQELRDEYGNAALDVATYTKSDGTIYAYVAREGGGGVSVVNVSQALLDNVRGKLSADSAGAGYYTDIVSRLGKPYNPYPSDYTYRENAAQSHTVFVGGQYLYVASQTDLVDVWSLATPATPQKVGVVRLVVDRGTDQPLGQTLNVPQWCYFRPVAEEACKGTAYVGGQPVAVDTVVQRPSVHELYAQETGPTSARLYVAYTRGGLHVLDVNMGQKVSPSGGACSTAFDCYISRSNYQKAVYDIDRNSPSNDYSMADPDYDFRATHSAWPLQNGDYVVTTDEIANDNPDESPDYHPINVYSASVPAVDGDRLTGVEAAKQAGYFLRVWKRSELGTGTALKAGYDVPETAASVGVTSLSSIVKSTIPNSVHQVHSLGNYLYVAGYTQGFRVLDVREPWAPVEVGYYDSYPLLSTAFTDPRRFWGTGAAFEGVFGVFPDPHPTRQGIVYASSFKFTLDSSRVHGVMIMKHVTSTLDVATIPHDVILDGTRNGTSNATFSVPNDVTISGSATVTVRNGTTLAVAANKVIRAQAGSVLKIDPNVTFSMAPNAQLASWGKIEAVGTLTQPVRFQRTNPAAAWSTSNAWKEVSLLGNDNQFKYVVFEGGNPNLTVASRNNLFQFCRFKNAWRGISSYQTLSYGRSQFRIEDSIIEGNNTVGLVGYISDVEVTRTRLQGNGETGATLIGGADLTGLSFSRVRVNAWGGLHVSYGTDAYFPPYALNRLYNNGWNTAYTGPRADLRIDYGGYFDGLSSARSSILDTTGTVPAGRFLVVNGASTLYANETFWGGGAPLATWFSPTGSVYDPYPMPYEWASGAGPGGTVPLSRGVEGPVLTVDGAVSAADDARRWVREHDDDPSAPARLWALYGTSRRPDAVGNARAERAADAALFEDLAERLADGRPLTGAARRTAETALALAVRSAMKDGRYGESRALLDRHLPRVEPGDVARALRFDRVTLLDLGGRTDEALVLLAALEAEAPEDPAPRLIRETLTSTAWIRAAAQAEAASEAEALRTTRTPTGAPEVFEARAYPNPARGRAVVRYALPEAGPVRVEIYDALGRRVVQLADGAHAAGRYEAALDAGALPAGLYLWRVAAGDRVRTGRVVLVK